MGSTWIQRIKPVNISYAIYNSYWLPYSWLFLIYLGKEARKKELKKNKKQRQLVRAAVLKNKDPSQILEEMEKIDEMGIEQ